jgi:thymidylate kinase
MHNLKNTNDKKKEEETEFKKITELFTNIVKQHQDIFIVVKQNQELQKTLLDFSSKILGKNL